MGMDLYFVDRSTTKMNINVFAKQVLPESTVIQVSLKEDNVCTYFRNLSITLHNIKTA